MPDSSCAQLRMTLESLRPHSPLSLKVIHFYTRRISCSLVPQGAPTFTRKPQILQKTSDSGDPAIVFDIGYQADRNPEVIGPLLEIINQ